MSPEHRFLTRCLLFALPCFGSLSCYSPAKTLPPAQAEALTWSEEAETAFRAGRYSAAMQGYKAALDLHITAGHTPGIVRNLVNLAVVQHTAGQNAAARESLAALDRHLGTLGSPTFDKETRTLLAEAGWLKAHMLLDEDRLAEALAVLDQQDSSAAGSRLYNLRARLLLAQGHPSEARSAARQAWRAAKGDVMELGDAARYQARSAELLGEQAEAVHWYEKAIPLDQAASRQHLVADDRLGIARASRKREAANLLRQP
jgi:tetratricopeptide (TPR) repeat protein